MSTWNVLPHSPLTRLASSVWIVDGTLKGIGLPRRMTVVRDSDGGLVIHSPIAVDEATLTAIVDLGRVKTIVVPNGHHRLDAPAYRARFPEATWVAPRGSKAKVEERVPVDYTHDAVPETERLRFVHVDGTKELEGALVVRDSDDATLIVNDIIFNMPHVKGVFPFIYGRLMGNFGKPRITTIFRFAMLKDKRAFREALRAFAAIPQLARIVVSHGGVITESPRSVLEELAASV